MPHSRSVDNSGVVITTLSGMVTLKEFVEIQIELRSYIHEGEVYELVLHSDDFRTALDGDETLTSAESLQNLLKGVRRAAIAFVSRQAFAYGLCRQLQMRAQSEFVQICVFRTEETARAWLREMQLSNKSRATTADGLV